MSVAVLALPLARRWACRLAGAALFGASARSEQNAVPRRAPAAGVLRGLRWRRSFVRCRRALPFGFGQCFRARYAPKYQLSNRGRCGAVRGVAGSRGPSGLYAPPERSPGPRGPLGHRRTATGPRSSPRAPEAASSYSVPSTPSPQRSRMTNLGIYAVILLLQGPVAAHGQHVHGRLLSNTEELRRVRALNPERRARRVVG